MKVSNILLALTLAAGTTTTTASPTARLRASRRSCPNIVYPDGLLGTGVTLAKNPAIDRTCTMSFTMPAGAPGPCSLVQQFPQGWVKTGDGSQVLVNVYEAPGDGGPAPGALVGTTQMGPNPWWDGVVTINSFACRPGMKYVFDIASAQGSVQFTEQAGKGVWMTYGC